MSANRQSKKHIQMIAIYAYTNLEIKEVYSRKDKAWLKFSNAAEVARMLDIEQLKSLGYRYEDFEANAHYFEPTTQPITILPGDMHMMMRGYDYQSCEHDDYHVSPTKRLLQDMLGKMAEEHFESAEPSNDVVYWSVLD